MHSVDHLLDFVLQFIKSGLNTHIHEFTLRIHLQSSHYRRIDLEFNSELLALILRVWLQSREHFLFLFSLKFLGGYDSDFLLLIELLIQFHILLSHLLKVHKPFVFNQDLYEPYRQIIEIPEWLQRLIELLDFRMTHSCVQSELLEWLWVLVQLTQELHVFIHVIQCIDLTSWSKKHARIAARDCVFFRRRLLKIIIENELIYLVVRSRLDLFYIAHRERLKQRFVKLQVFHFRLDKRCLKSFLPAFIFCHAFLLLFLRFLLWFLGFSSEVSLLKELGTN